MSKIYTSADQLIGKTPLLELTHIEKEEKLEARILAKLEYFNPAGSVKDRDRSKWSKISLAVVSGLEVATYSVYPSARSFSSSSRMPG